MTTTDLNPVTTCRGCGESSNGRYCETCETQVVFHGFTRAELSDAFDLVKDPTNWKNPIETVLPLLLGRERQSCIQAAVVFYAGCDATFTPAGVSMIVRAAGYYAAVGA